MAPFRSPGFAGRLSRLDRAAFVEFLVDLWGARNRDARVEDGVLIEGDGTRLLVHHPPRWRPSGSPAVDDRAADGIVTSRRVDDPPDGVRVIDADDLRRMLLYAVDSPAREALSGRYLGGEAPSREGVDGGRTSVPVGAGAVGVVGVLLIVAAVVAAGGFGGLPAGPDSPSGTTPTAARLGATATPVPVATSTARSTPPTPAPTASGTPSGSMPLALDRDGTQYDDGPYPVPLEIEGEVTVLEFTHPGEEGYFALWTDEGNGTGRFLAGGQGAASVRVLVDLPPGRHTLLVRSIGRWRLQVRPSHPPSVLGLTQAEVRRGPATAFGGPVEFLGATNVTVRGIDPNATYHGVLVDPENVPRNVLVDRAGPTGPVSTVVDYRGTGYVKMTSTGRWVVVLRPAERGGPPHFVEVLRDGADGR